MGCSGFFNVGWEVLGKYLQISFTRSPISSENLRMSNFRENEVLLMFLHPPPQSTTTNLSTTLNLKKAVFMAQARYR